MAISALFSSPHSSSVPPTLSLKRKRDEAAEGHKVPRVALPAASTPSQASGLQNLPLAVPPPTVVKGEKLKALSFSQACIRKIANSLMSSTTLAQDIAGLVAQYVMSYEDAFGSKQWEEHLHHNPGPELLFSDKLIDYWIGPDPFNPAKQVYETHLPPIRSSDLSLKALGLVVKKCGTSFGVSYTYETTEALDQHGDTPAGPACWLVMRRNLLFPGKSYDEQASLLRQKGFEPPCALHVVTVIFLRFVVHRECHFLRDEPARFSHCSEVVEDRMFSGKYPLIVGGFDRSGVVVELNYDKSYNTGIVALRTFT